MPRFSKKSKLQLKTCDEDLQTLFSKVIETYDCTIIQGHRSKEEQDEYFRTGKSKLKYPKSKHNSTPSMAVDAAPYPIQWNNKKRFYHFAGFVSSTYRMLVESGACASGYKLIWGGDWDNDNNLDDQTFMDLVHFQIVEI